VVPKGGMLDQFENNNFRRAVLRGINLEYMELDFRFEVKSLLIEYDYSKNILLFNQMVD